MVDDTSCASSHDDPHMGEGLVSIQSLYHTVLYSCVFCIVLGPSTDVMDQMAKDFAGPGSGIQQSLSSSCYNANRLRLFS